jgi:hypothetical protein
MRTASFLLLLLACGSCGGAKPEPDPPITGTASGVVEDDRTQLQIRQEAACEQTGRKLKQCAIEDNQRQSPEERREADVENTAPILEREYIKACTEAEMSSRQVRVHEVCLREESECEPFLDCLDNAKPQK